jgi:hypothetical protein
MMAAFQSYANTDVAIGSAKDRLSGFGDLAIDPFILGWHFGNWNVAAGIDWYLPTGNYDKRRAASPGRNYVTMEPVVAVTYLDSAGYEASAKVMFDHNWENSATHYRSGNELHADDLLGKHIGKWAFGLGGYAYQQVSDDSGKGASLGGFRGRVYAAGPHVAYNAEHFNVTARWNHEFDAHNKTEGEQFWLRFVVPI